jgi:RHS repeat-associated protein
LGSVIALTDSNGAVQTSYNYTPFGKKFISGTASDNPYAFTGREDDGTGLYFYRARYYNPDQKRFIAPDPIELSGGDTNFQAYVGNDPVNETDPSGMLFELIWNDAKQRNDHRFDKDGKAVTYKEFLSYAKGKSLDQLQRDYNASINKTESNSLKERGPIDRYRYVIDPGHPNQVIDMRHFLVVGRAGELFGLFVEIDQNNHGWSSAFNAQDFLSNALGSKFYRYYANLNCRDASIPLELFFKNREKGIVK